MTTESKQLATSLEADLRARFDVIESEVAAGGRSYRLLRPRSADDLISEEDFDVDGRLPYWPEVWPSSRVLADYIATQSGDGKSFLELGCGLGFVSLVAAQVGFAALASDYYSEPLEFLQLNAARNGLVVPATRMIDWRSLPDDLGQFDMIVAADVLYEKPMCGLIASTIKKLLKPDGRAVVTDPSRLLAAGFRKASVEHGLCVTATEEVPFPGDQVVVPVRVYHLRHA